MALRHWTLGTAAVLGALALPMILGRVPPNAMYGLRTPLTRSSPEIWYAANTFAGWALLAAALATTVLLLAAPRRWADHDGYPIGALLGPVAAAVVACWLHLGRYA